MNKTLASIRATYRVQMHAGFGFDQAAGITDYLADLGISHLYTSPYLQANCNSLHGYDTVDCEHVNAELGGPAGREHLVTTLQKHGLGQVLDIVPNHMGTSSPENRWWWDVLENGQSSKYTDYFDIDWTSPDDRLRGKVLLPILGDHYGRILEAGELKLERMAGRFVVRYFDHTLPINFCTLGGLFNRAAGRCQCYELAYMADTMGQLPRSSSAEPSDPTRCARDRDVLVHQMERLLAEDANVAQAVDQAIAEINRDADAMDHLLSQQHYRLAWWRTASQEINYRRFFDINQLVGLRVEQEAVFAATHALILQWVQDGQVAGLRVDHPDGLRDPTGYFERLSKAAPNAWIVAEKILQPGERLPAAWPIDGTTGYDFLNHVNSLFVNPAGEQDLSEFYKEFTGQTADIATISRQKKHQILRSSFGSEVNRLVHLLAQACQTHRQVRDYTRDQMKEALCEAIACFPVYRTYIRPHHIKEAAIDDVRHIRQAIDTAGKNRPDIDGRLLKFLADILLLQVRGDSEAELVLRFQQISGPIMAKAIEDTTFYCYNRLVSLNEVGGDPGLFGTTLEAFHRTTVRMAEEWPHTMNSTSTHDTKRSEDVRARINLLSGIAQRWAEAVQRWSSMNDPFRRNNMPDRNMEYLLYQTLVGAWPIDADRLATYLQKAAREAKVHTSWTDPNLDYEEAIVQFARSILNHPAFIEDVQTFIQPLIALGRINSLSQTLIKFTAPGVPDIYQGCELWDLSLVDPDNRRPVNYDSRRCMLAELDHLTVQQILTRAQEGLPKLWLTRQALRLRRNRPEVFETGDYRPMMATGEKADHVVAFSRQDRVITVAPRLIISLDSDWSDTRLELPGGSWENVLTNQTIEGGPILLTDLLDQFPVALLSQTS